MTFKVINAFKDKDDNDTYYRKGDTYPREGYKPTQKRVDELTKTHPRYKVAFIEEVKEKKKTEKKK